MPEENDEIAELMGDMKSAAATLYLTQDHWHEAEFRAALEHLIQAFVQQKLGFEGLFTKYSQSTLGDKAQLLLGIRCLKQVANEIAKVSNKMLPALESDLCVAIVESGLDAFATKTHKFTASAESFLSKMPSPGDAVWALYQEWLETCPDPAIRELIDITLADADYQRLKSEIPELESVTYRKISEKAMGKLTRKLLADGQALPPGVETFVKATVHIRHK